MKNPSIKNRNISDAERREALFSCDPTQEIGVYKRNGERIPIHITDANRIYFGPSKNKFDYPELRTVGSAIVASALELEMQTPREKRGVSLVDTGGNCYSDLIAEQLTIDHISETGTLKHTAFFSDKSGRTDGLILAVDDIAAIAAAYRPVAEVAQQQVSIELPTAEEIAA